MARRTAKVGTAEIEEAEEKDMMRRECPVNTSSTMPLLRRMHHDVQKEMAKVTSEEAKRMRPLFEPLAVFFLIQLILIPPIG